MFDRQQHQLEVRRFLQEHFSIHDWSFSLPRSGGRESYFAQGNGQRYFVKVGVQVERYLALAEVGLTPPVLTYSRLEDDFSIMVQPFVAGQTPTRVDYRHHLVKVAECIRKMHHSQRVREIVPPTSSTFYKDAGLRALNRLRQKWDRCAGQVPSVAEFIDKSFAYLSEQIHLFSGEGLVVSHGDICNANWLFASDGNIYLLDFESMSIDDPALDLGALLWWYYPPELRQRFLDIVGYPYDDESQFRMRVRMAMHCLDITLPREQSFDTFDPDHYGESLRDFRAILNGEENPEGYS